jgi:DNA-binding transcriptional regulator YiaG
MKEKGKNVSFHSKLNAELAEQEIAMIDEGVDEDGWTPNSELDCAEWLKSLREKAGLSAIEVANSLGIPYQTYSQWESGRRKPPYYVIQMITTILNQAMMDAKKNTNDLNLSTRIRNDLTFIGCPVFIRSGVKVVSVVDELGDRNYYVTLGRIAPHQIGLFKYWLGSQFDDKLSEELELKAQEVFDTAQPADIAKFRHDVLDSQRAIWTKKYEGYSTGLQALSEEVRVKRKKLVDDIKQ